MAIYTKSGGEIKSVTPYLKRNGEVITPTSVWVKTGGEVHKVWPVEEPVPEGPFEIYDQATLEEFRDRVNAGEYDLDAVVTADFSMDGTWETGIGGQSISTAYRGTFDGQNHTITGVTVDSSEVFAGFLNASRGTIKDLHLAETSVTGTSYAGGVVGYTISGTMTGCSSSGSVTATGDSSYAGGVVGYTTSGTITSECTNDSSVTATASRGYAGGIAGNNNGTMEACTNEGEISAARCAGGIVGHHSMRTVAGCTNSGTVTAIETDCIGSGGIVGWNQDTVEGCENGGAVNAPGDAGGIAGNNRTGTVSGCTNTGTVTATASHGYAGGIVGYGYNNETGTVTGCTNSGTVVGAYITVVDGETGTSTEEAASTEEE